MIENQLIQKASPYKHWQYLDFETGNRLRIVPERGGLITEWRCNGKEILYFDLDRFKSPGKSIRGGIPILFPICGDLPGGILPLSNRNFLINQHGFARDIPWKIQFLENHKVISLNLSASNKTLAVFPFNFFIEIQLKLDFDSLDINIFIHNFGKDRMPCSFGLHPYFRVSSLDNIAIKGLSEICTNHLDMCKSSTEIQMANITEGIDFLTTSKDKHSVELIDLHDLEIIEMQAKNPMDLVVVWTDPPRSMVCLEPWTSPRKSLITGDRTIFIESGERKEIGCKFLSKKIIKPEK
tara:strand:+ start:3627 stop:4511 length:885 start_codon:yes stop_codon:yes gene_type:complete